MNTQGNKSRYLPLLIAGIAVILSSSAGIAAIMGWLPASTGGSGDVLALDFPVASAKPAAVPAQTLMAQVEGKTRAKGRCAECGVIVSTREIDAHDDDGGLDAAGGAVARSQDEPGVKSARRYEITIRLADRSSRVLHHASPASWRPGERVIVIDGTNPSNR